MWGRSVPFRPWVWKVYLASLTLVTVIAINFFIPGSSIKCVQCSSEKRPDCFENPPPSSACEKDMKVCRTVKELWPNDTVVSVSRECFTTEQEESCTAVASTGSRICQWTCNEDGCNAGSTDVQFSSTLVAFLVTANLINAL